MQVETLGHEHGRVKVKALSNAPLDRHEAIQND